MADFINTIDLLGDDVAVRMLVDKTIAEYNDDSITTVGNYAFYECKALISIDLPSVTSIGNYSFMTCSNLTTIILRNNAVCTLANINAFDGTPFASGGTGGTVYVPPALITEYQNATNWSSLYAGGKCNFVAREGSEYE